MFDKITIRAKISDEECHHLAELHRLQAWTNANKTLVDYRSTQHANITGIQVKIMRNTLTLTTSLHKYWNKNNYGRLRNDNMFTISEARVAFADLLFENGILPERVKVVQFEVGINLNVSYDPLTFIELVQFIGIADKLMFVDANYKVNRQRTTVKYRDIRKYYKIYDKGWEMEEKKRGAATELVRTAPNILRIETVYRRHNERGDKFFSEANVKRLAQRFYVDWKDLFFFREVRAYKGARKSEVLRAGIIVNIGGEEYLKRSKEEFEAGKMTAKQFRTIREFIRDYEEDSNRFKTIVSQQEREYNKLLFSAFDISRE